MPSVQFIAVLGVDNTKRAGAISLVSHPRVLEARSFFSSVVLTSVLCQVWMQQAAGKIYVVGPYPSTAALPTTVSEVLAVPHATMLASNAETDIIHTFDLKFPSLELDLATVPIRSGHPDIWFGLGSEPGQGTNGTSFVIRAVVTVDCSGESFGLVPNPVQKFSLGIVDKKRNTGFILKNIEDVEPGDRAVITTTPAAKGIPPGDQTLVEDAFE
jgi:hypothetical protein